MFLADLKLYRYLTTKRSQKLAKAVSSHLQNNGTLLDLGGGNMLTSIALSDLLPQVKIHGIDVIRDQNLPDSLPDNVLFSTYDGNSIPFESHSFDQALVCSTLHHTTDPEFFMSELVRVIKPGGNLIVVEEMYTNWVDLAWIAGLDWILNKLKKDVPVPLNFRTYNQYDKIFNELHLKQYAHSHVRPAFPWQRLEIYAFTTPALSQISIKSS
jgi:ubiquinone/menaquinone biosynthesis C-methylase UbiE